MGIQINGSNDTIQADDGSLSLAGSVSYEDVTNVTSVGLSTFSSGIHIDDSITHLGDTNTKIRFPAADTVTVETSGSEQMRIDSSGRLLLGTTTEGAANADDLTVSSSGDTGITIRSGTSSYGSIFFSDGTSGSAEYVGAIQYNHASNFFTIGANGSESLRIDSSGRMGLGTNSPAEKLHVNATGTTAGDGAIVARFYDTAQSKGLFLGYDSNEVGGTIYGANLLTFQTYNGSSWGERMRLDGSGRLLIGTTSSIAVAGAETALQVEGTTADTSRISVINRGNNTGGGGIQIAKSRGTQPALVQDDDQVGGIFFAAGDANDFVSQPAKIECFIDGAPSGSDTPGRLTFSTCPDQTDTPVERMRITSSGNIGIGKDPTTSYGRNLQIHSTGTNGAAIHLTDASTGGSSSDGFHLVNTNSGNVYFWNRENTSQIFATNGSERLRIAASGNVGIGEDNPSSNLVVNQSGSTFTTQSQTVALFQRSSTTGHGAKIAIVAGNASGSDINFGDTDDEDVGKIQYLHTDNSFRFTTNTAERMVIDSSGRLLLNSGTDVRMELGTTGTTGTNNRNHIRGDGSSLKYNTCSGGLHIFEQNGTERLRIDNSGNMSLGSSTINLTAAARTTLSLNGTNSSLLAFNYSDTISGYFYAEATEFRMEANGTRPLVFRGNSATLMKINSSGTVDIGNSSSPASANVHFDLYCNSSYDGFIRFRDESGAPGIIGFDHGSNAMRFYTNGSSEAMRIDSSGRVLIGTTTQGWPGADELTIATSGATGITIRSASNNVGAIFFADGASGSQNYQGIIQYKHSTDSLQFYTNYAGDSSTRMEISNTGNLTLKSTGAKTLIVGSTNSASSTLILDGDADGDGNGADYAYLQHTTAGDLDIVNLKSGITRFKGAGGVERMTVESTGQVSISHGSSGSTVLYCNATDSAYNTNVQQNRVSRTAHSGFVFLSCRSNGGGDIEFNLRGDGNAYADGSWNGGGADYAEFFEWSDGNTSAEDRRGISVVLDGDKIREATSGEEPIGVISGNPSVVGDADMERWKGKYLRDEYGAYDLDENGDRKLNPDYDPESEYISRENRAEWDCVGLMGKIRIRKGQVTGSRWIKMRDINDSVEEWLVR